MLPEPITPSIPPSDSKKTLVQHLTELRACLIRSLIGLTVSMGICLFFSKNIFVLLQKPLLDVMPAGSSFISTSPLEALITYLQVSLLAGVFLACPYLMYQIWLFVAPGLLVHEKKMAMIFVFFASLFFVGGALFGYFFIFPVGFKFFVTVLEGTGIQFLPQMEDYLGFISKMLLTFGLIFELPLLIVGTAQVGLIKREMLTKARRYVLVAIFLIAGILTPGPDVLSQFLLAIPLLGLYELSIIAVWFLEKRKNA
ncbi:MAG: twin-arginine translocase subunit TatC [Deltaproteobacteria bacterium]|nr:MAG: twin-arginine translocase subunit TatC [Deltaproteobacteria bacterium]